MIYKIKYNKSGNIEVENVEAKNTIDAQTRFYMKHGGSVDILDIRESEDESES